MSLMDLLETNRHMRMDSNRGGGNGGKSFLNPNGIIRPSTDGAIGGGRSFPNPYGIIGCRQAQRKWDRVDEEIRLLG
ncbi:hypothetical protein C1H46_021273 [Malus baccata]|uniref:Uncharacterized protein n=1 Tax=Malus baccata TaxID=106549 RepID=A0A540M3K0_MALBA|nr:hypothetical protein C1H46_021273 [Malus baccata]